MAKRQGVSKSKAIRDYYQAHPKAKAQDVVDALKSQGITTTTNYVANTKATHNKRGRAAKKVVAKGGVGLAEIKAAFSLLKLCGGPSEAKEALAAAIEIKSLV